MMAGTFATWQREYETIGIPTFPFMASEHRKRPLVRAYDNIRMRGSRQLALKFPDADGLACVAGQRNNLTVIDVDVGGAEGERLVADVQREVGGSRFITRTGGRGGYHVYYQHAGERRLIKVGGRPIDLLGGGPIVLPPSQGRFARYEIIHGKLDDLRALTPIREATPAFLDDRGFADLRCAQIGERDKKLWPYIKRCAHQAKNYEDLLGQAREINGLLATPLTDAEIVDKVRYWWLKTERGENKWGIGQFSIIDHSVIDELLIKDSDAFTLLMIIQRHHWGRSFHMANEMCNSMPDGGWRRQRFTAARKRLVNQWKIVREISPASFNPPRAALYILVDRKEWLSKNGQ